jgi:hypothetical protein
VRNYVRTEDWVVALFPRLFELRPVLWLNNALGGAGFNGFDDGGGCMQTSAPQSTVVTKVCYLKGKHSAFEGRVTKSSFCSPRVRLTRNVMIGRHLAGSWATS